MLFDTLETLRGMAGIYAPCGDEGLLAAHIARLAGPLADEHYTDALGNLIVRKKGMGKRVMFSAHMDSPALAATHIDENGFIRVCAVGGIKDARHCAARFANGVTGAVCCPDEKSGMYIDVGASSREKTPVRAGDMAVLSAETYLTGNSGRVVSPCLSGRVGCAVLLRALSMIGAPQNDLFFVFTVQNEAGMRGAKTAAFGVEPERAVAVDVTDAGDTPEAEKAASTVRLGGGAAVKIRDKTLVAHPDVVKWIETAAADNGIPVQRDLSNSGGTDAGAIHLSRGGVPSGAVSVPVRYRHTLSEMAALRDIESCARLIAAAAGKGWV